MKFRNTMELKKFVASVLAVASITAIGSTMSPVLAYERLEEQQELFVNAFEEGIDRDVAQYLLDNGYSLEEAENAMDIYMDGLEAMNASSTTSTTTTDRYYNTSDIAKTEHFVLAIATTPDSSCSAATIQVSLDPDFLESSDDAFILPSYESYVDTATSSYGFNKKTGKWVHTTSLSGIDAMDTSTAHGMVRYPVSPKSTVTTEYQLYQNVGFSSMSMPNDYGITYETYARGDVDHNGVVNSTDSTLLMQFLVQRNTLNITYADGSNHYSFVTNVMAADYSLDGIVSILDVTQLDRYLSEHGLK
jgi:hypothetical protein